MRALNEYEKELCRRIMMGQPLGKTIPNLIKDQLGPTSICINRPKQEVSIVLGAPEGLEQVNQESVAEIFENVSLVVLTAINLVVMLESNGYVMLLSRNREKKLKFEFGNAPVNTERIIYSIPDMSIANLLIRHHNKCIYITEEFKEYCKNGFVTRSDRQFNRQIRTTNWILITAVLALIANLIMNLVQ